MAGLLDARTCATILKPPPGLLAHLIRSRRIGPYILSAEAVQRTQADRRNSTEESSTSSSRSMCGRRTRWLCMLAAAASAT